MSLAEPPDGEPGACRSGPRSLERRESFADAAGERDDLLAFVEGDRLSTSGRGFERLSEVVERVPLMPWRVCTQREDHSFVRKCSASGWSPRVE